MLRQFRYRLLASFLMTCSAVAIEDARPNILFIAIDDLNDWVGCLGGHPQARTPNIDMLAERGVLFTNAHCAAPVCSPSRAAVMSGLRPETTGIYTNADDIRSLPELMTMPEYFKDNGYETLGAGKLFHGGKVRGPKQWTAYGPTHTAGGAKGGPFTNEEIDSGLQRPFNRVERLDVSLPINGMPADRVERRGNSFDWGPVNVDDSAMSDGIVADWGIEQLAAPSDKPFFLGLGFYRPHMPLYAPAKYFDQAESEVTLPPVQENDLDDLSRTGREFALFRLTAGAHHNVVGHSQWDEAVAAYLASVRFVDAQVGRIMDALDSSPHADNTIVMLWSDHGWHLGEKQHWGKFTGWEPSTRVPLIIAPPRNNTRYATGMRCDRSVSLLDLFPTLTAMAGLETPAELEGRSLLPLLAQPDADWPHPAVTTFGRGNVSIRAAQWRYIRYFDGTRELYDIHRDPEEWANLAKNPEHREIMDQLDSHAPHDRRILRTARVGNLKVIEGRAPGESFVVQHDRAAGLEDAAAYDGNSGVASHALNRVAAIETGRAVTLESAPAPEPFRWESLFDKSNNTLDAWTVLPRRGRSLNSRPRPITGGWRTENAELIHQPSGGYLWTKEAFDNFVLELDVNMPHEANSGVFFWGQLDDHTNRGLEIQLFGSSDGIEPGKHAMGALYDAAAPVWNAMMPPGEWQRLRIAVDSPWVAVSLNGRLILRRNLDDWKEPGVNPDGSENKFKSALALLPRRGHIGLQDHGDVVRFRNIRVMRLDGNRD